MTKLPNCHQIYNVDRGKSTPNRRRPRTIHEFLRDKGVEPTKKNDLPKGVVRLGDLIQDFLSTHNK